VSTHLEACVSKREHEFDHTLSRSRHEGAGSMYSSGRRQQQQ
jgi:hypothetical protein